MAVALLTVLTALAMGAGPSAAGKALPPARTLVWRAAGGGDHSTEKFSVTGDWDLDWQYDCSSFGGSSVLIVKIMNPDGTQSGNLGVDQMGRSDRGVEHYHIGGTYYLHVLSPCRWHLEVWQLPQG
ncbi:MAG: hypothetical protein WA005_00580 [Candidatus Binataceae bacterium]